MTLSATNNWVFIDLEAAAREYKDSVDPQKARIIQIGLSEGGSTNSMLVNPGFTIPVEITELTGITPEKLAYAPPFGRLVATALADRLRGRTVAGYNCHRYDVPLLAEEFERAGIDFDWESVKVVDIGTLYMQMKPRNLAAACREYLGFEPKHLHDAGIDAEYTQQVAEKMLAAHAELKGKSEVELEALSRYGKRMADPAGLLAYDDQGRLVYNTRKNQGVLVESEPGYARWMLERDFPLSTLRLLRQELDRIDEQNESPSLFTPPA